MYKMGKKIIYYLFYTYNSFSRDGETIHDIDRENGYGNIFSSFLEIFYAYNMKYLKTVYLIHFVRRSFSDLFIVFVPNNVFSCFIFVIYWPSYQKKW